MRVVLTSDLHGALPEIPECDLLIIAGDVCPDFLRQFQRGVSHKSVETHKGEPEQGTWLKMKFVPWLRQTPAKQRVLIAGNHDFVFEVPRLIPDELHEHCYYLKDSGIIAGGINIWGTPWVPNLPFWAFYGNGDKLGQAYNAIPEDTEILVTHGPPFAYGDLVGPRFGGPEHVGSMQCFGAIKRVRPQMTVCGHIHEAYGFYRVENEGEHLTDVYNVSLMTDRYEPIQKPVVIDL
jgi:Icc-related predicted phosphoesterase